jgi:hypothetical protein
MASPAFLAPASLPLRVHALSLLPPSALARTSRARRPVRARGNLAVCASTHDPSRDAGVGNAAGETGGAAAPAVANRETPASLADSPPLEYDRAKLKAYWDARSSELNQRYLSFAATAAPFFASVVRHTATRTLSREDVIARLAVQAREGMEALGPTYVYPLSVLLACPVLDRGLGLAALSNISNDVAVLTNRHVCISEFLCDVELESCDLPVVDFLTRNS